MKPPVPIGFAVDFFDWGYWVMAQFSRGGDYTAWAGPYESDMEARHEAIRFSKLWNVTFGGRTLARPPSLTAKGK